jgi:hypothetical protein
MNGTGDPKLEEFQPPHKRDRNPEIEKFKLKTSSFGIVIFQNGILQSRKLEYFNFYTNEVGTPSLQL